LAEALAPAWTALGLAAPLVLLWLAVFFGRTLRAGQTPLIERIARRSSPGLSEPLRRYTRRLTAVWCVYFVLAAAVTAAANWLQLLSVGPVQLAVWSATALLFVGERGLRPILFPGETFPGLIQQIRDTVGVWHVPR
jgi:uncharacterized membrane protein